MPTKVMTNIMKRNLFSVLLMLLVGGWVQTAIAQIPSNAYQSQNFRLGEAFYRVAEATQLADTVLIWGDIQLPGTYLVPRGVNLAQMVAFSRGPANIRNNETDLDWSKMFMEITVTNKDSQISQSFKVKVDGSIPAEMFETRMRNYDTIVIRVRRKATVLDYVRAYTPIVSGALSTFLLYKTIQDL